VAGQGSARHAPDLGQALHHAGPVATLLGLAFRLDPEHLLGGEEDLGITCALMPTDTPGVNIGRRHLPLGAPFHERPELGQGRVHPDGLVIGGREYAGKGWRC
jgi:acyl-CoA dehydrogenase